MSAPPVFDLKGRTALVTGASSGLGARFASILAAAGAQVVLAARRKDNLDALCAHIIADGGKAIAVSMDVADEAATIAAYDAAEAAFGTVDTVIANAGINNSAVQMTEMSVDDFDRVTDINLRGVFLTVREGGKRMMAAGSREKQNGRIVIISSLAALGVEPGLAAYSASKAGVFQMGKVLARDWVRMGINVNMICPGYIKTEMNDTWFESVSGQAKVAAMHRRRLMEERDLDVPLLYLASDASRAVTGSHIMVDDGQSL
jgi:NAD(P)-dependent dehydrogenase (short-subunit alcohol dehydrogenase family)